MTEWIEKIESADSPSAIEEIRVAVFGKKGVLAKAFAEMKTAANEDKARIAKELNETKAKLNTLLNEKKVLLETKALQEAMKAEGIDVSLFSPTSERGATHPVMDTMDRVIEYFTNLNFSVETGPMVEDDFHNFEALNLPKYHPARDMQDTFYFKDESLLRTHTSPVQIRTMMNTKPPIQSQLTSGLT